MVAADPAVRSAIARKAAHRMHAIHGRDATAAARAALSRKFVDAARALLPPGASEADLARTALQLRKEFYADLQVRAAKARAARKVAAQ